MHDAQPPPLSETESVLHPFDLAEGGEVAFAHALALALLGRGRLMLLHVARDSDVAQPAWAGYPAVRRTLERWGLLEPGSERRDVVDRLGMDVVKVRAQGSAPTEAVLHYARQEAPDLIVLATEGRQGLPRWIHPSAAERIARHARSKALFVPDGVRGFVEPEEGATHLRRVLVPVDRTPDAGAAARFATELAEALGDPPVQITLLHVGDADVPQPLAEGAGEGEPPAWRVRHRRRSGRVVDEILAEAEEQDADLLVAATAGHQGLLDALRGSVTERIVREAPCPVLAVPQR